MNHLQMFRYVQENTELFSYEVRSLMRTINNDLDLPKMKEDLCLLIKFVDLKLQDENKYNSELSNESMRALLLPNLPTEYIS